MNGRIWLESNPDQGSTFHFTARFGRGTPAAGPASATSSELDGLRVLIVDDNATTRGILKEIVTSWKMQPLGVSSGREALAAVANAARAGSPFAIVLLDGTMPDLDGFQVAERLQALAESVATIMMLSSADNAGHAARCRALGVVHYVRKPVTAAELLDAIQTALRSSTVKQSRQSKAVAFPESGASSILSGRLCSVLLAEDNVVNQRVAVRILEKRGHTVTAVANGLEAVQALACQKFDLVLMDVQMPQMDGLDATAAIRRAELPLGSHVPIIAMTAHAMKGDRERCLAAGMDDYVSKPVNAEQLFAVIERTLSACQAAARAAKASVAVEPASALRPGMERGGQALGSSSVEPAPVFDLAALRASLEEDTDLLEELVELFLGSAPALVSEIDTAVAQQDGRTVERAAHALKGALRNLFAANCAQAAQQVESLGRAGELNDMDESLARLKNELSRLQSALNEVLFGVDV